MVHSFTLVSKNKMFRSDKTVSIESPKPPKDAGGSKGGAESGSPPAKVGIGA